MDRWLVSPSQQGFDVTHNGRAFAYDLDDADEAIRAIRRKVGPGVSVSIEDDTGYRTKVRT